MEFDENSLVKDIKDKLKSLKLSYQGTKSQCLKRLKDYFEQQLHLQADQPDVRHSEQQQAEQQDVQNS